MANTRIITLLTDFGLRDHFVAAMKGVMLSLNPEVALVDISHLVPPQDILSGAFILGQAWSYFPMGTIHMAVVDPGVGTTRKALAAAAGGHFFVAPDNGLLSYVMQRRDDFRAHEITAEHYFRKPVSASFHGRDVFAPIAAWLSREIPLAQIGPSLSNPVRLPIPTPKRVRDNLVQGAILAMDQFGNLTTNLLAAELPRWSKILAGSKEITAVHRTFGEGNPGELFIIPGSTGYLEIVVRDGSAASLLGIKAGAPIGVFLV